MSHPQHPVLNVKTILLSMLVSLFGTSKSSFATGVPRPDHVVICILENHDYHQIMGSSDAPYLNSLATQGAKLQEYYALTHPSQPNYIMLFSGSNQGETTDNLPSGTPWSTPNLGASLIDNGFTFETYSEDLPTTGSTVGSSGAYARKHCPWVNWQGNGTNQIPSSTNLSSDDFPSNFSQLPDVSFVIPNQDNDMHNGSNPGKISTGDQWIEDHLKNYIDWAQTHNSLFIVVFDEDDRSGANHVVCLWVGPMGRPGTYGTTGYNHYDFLRTLEDMYDLPYAGNSANADPILEIWLASSTTGINDNDVTANSNVGIFPNPVTEDSRVVISNKENVTTSYHILIYDMAGRLKSDEAVEVKPGEFSYAFRKEGLASGLYTYRVSNERNILGSGKIVVE